HVDQTWASAFGLDPGMLHDTPARVVTPAPWLADYRGIYVLQLGETLLVSAPTSHREVATDIAAGRDPRDVARDIGGTLVGPSQHAYLHRDDNTLPAAPTTRRVEVVDLEPLRASVPDDDWHEGGFGPDAEVVWAAHDQDGTLVAAGNLTEFAARPADVGLVTHPAHRGRGYGRRLVADMTTWALTDGGADVVRYRALTTNHASLAVARHVGFVAYGENVAIRLPEPATL
ncbi:MAG: hypothetical protein V7636_1524, partial [Actinomycetota bacterium]